MFEEYGRRHVQALRQPALLIRFDEIAYEEEFHAALRNHDPRLKRSGTTTLFAALDLLQGKVIGDFHKHHRYQEFFGFLRHIKSSFQARKPYI